jgi:hypothetical protein
MLQLPMLKLMCCHTGASESTPEQQKIYGSAATESLTTSSTYYRTAITNFVIWLSATSPTLVQSAWICSNSVYGCRSAILPRLSLLQGRQAKPPIRNFELSLKSPVLRSRDRPQTPCLYWPATLTFPATPPPTTILTSWYLPCVVFKPPPPKQPIPATFSNPPRARAHPTCVPCPGLVTRGRKGHVVLPGDSQAAQPTPTMLPTLLPAMLSACNHLLR